MVEKKAADYSASAENLCNPAEVGLKLRELREIQSKIRTLEANLEAIPEFQGLQMHLEKQRDLDAQIRAMVDAQGSYQDMANGLYAVKYRRVSKTYKAQPFIENYPKYAPAVIENFVNTKALEGLVKGGLLDFQDLKQKGVVEETTSFAYYVR